MRSFKLKPIIEKLEEEFEKIQIKRNYKLLTVTPKLGTGFKNYKPKKIHYYNKNKKSLLEI
jgi:hypothetical protein